MGGWGWGQVGEGEGEEAKDLQNLWVEETSDRPLLVEVGNALRPDVRIKQPLPTIGEPEVASIYISSRASGYLLEVKGEGWSMGS